MASQQRLLCVGRRVTMRPVMRMAAIAAACLRRNRFGKVGIIDIDFHHGDGTQEIFYEHNDVFVASVHGSPEQSFPGFSGYADECGAGDGLGANLNIPFNIGQTFSAFAIPTLFVLEGGYAMHELGENVVNVLDGFEANLVAMQP